MPALAIAKALRAERPDLRVVLVGAQRGIEARLLPGRDYPFELLPAEPLYRRQWWKNLRWPFLLVRLLREVDRLLDRERPALVVGTGGYASAPVVWRAARRRIPTTLLELNAYPGLAVRRLAGSVNEIWLGLAEAKKHLRPGANTRVLETGAPIEPPDPGLRAGALRRFGLDPEVPVLLVTGGSQGALALNEAVAGWLALGASQPLQVLWATGRGTFERFAALNDPPRVQVFDFLDPIGPAYSVADLALGRAGMMTVAELCAWGIPSILVPLPTAAADHQTPNAVAMAQAGAAVHLPQRAVTPERLRQELTRLGQSAELRARMKRAALTRSHPEATRQIAARIGVYLG